MGTFNIGPHQSVRWNSGLCKKLTSTHFLCLLPVACLALSCLRLQSACLPTMLSCILNLWMHQVSCIHIFPWDLPPVRDLTFPLFSLLCVTALELVSASQITVLSHELSELLPGSSFGYGIWMRFFSLTFCVCQVCVCFETVSLYSPS